MERAGILINKLLQQFNDKAAAESLMVTAQMLIAELEQQPDAGDKKLFKAAVIMPASRNTGHAQQNVINENIIAPEPVMAAPQDLKKNDAPVEKEEKELVQQTIRQEDASIKQGEETSAESPDTANAPESTTTVSNSLQAHAHDVNETNKALFEEPAKEEAKHENFYSRFMPHDIPTLPKRQELPKEVHELKEDGEALSLNDKLKEIRKETGDSLHNEPVKDLRKAIGINDRYLFINELFRGDESMYERSIKTINSFNILAEADYWIQRELKTKLGWIESETTKQFDSLVKRRFV